MTSRDFHRIRNFHDRALTEADRACVHELGLDERKRMVDDLHVPFDGFDQAFEFLAKRHRPIAAAAHDRGKFHLLVGSFRSGKSWPVIHFAQRENAARGDRDHHPVVHVTCADGWGAKQVLSAIVQQLNGARPSDRYGVAAITESVINLLERFKVELVVIDELHEVMNRNKQGSLLMTNLRQVVDARHCNVVGVGEQSLHKTIKESCAYMAGRGGLLSHTVISPDWHAKEGKEDYRLFLDMVDDRLPFRRKSGLGIPRYAAHFYDMSKGSIGFTMSYVAAAAYLALDEGADRIEHPHLVKVAVEARGTVGTFTHFVDALPDNLVARREKAA